MQRKNRTITKTSTMLISRWLWPSVVSWNPPDDINCWLYRRNVWHVPGTKDMGYYWFSFLVYSFRYHITNDWVRVYFHAWLASLSWHLWLSSTGSCCEQASEILILCKISLLPLFVKVLHAWYGVTCWWYLIILFWIMLKRKSCLLFIVVVCSGDNGSLIHHR